MNAHIDQSLDIRESIRYIYRVLLVKGYNPVNQLVGYILTEDPTYITAHQDARKMITKIDRDILLRDMLEYYLRHSSETEG